MKIRFVVYVLAVLLLFVLAGKGIGTANDNIALALKTRLVEYPLPPDTELVDSIAIAGKISGNRNGMQYRGMLLLSSELTEDALQAHYGPLCKENEFLWVGPQESQMIDGYSDYWFEYWDNSHPMWYVELYTDSVVGFEESLWKKILNLDLRGH